MKSNAVDDLLFEYCRRKRQESSNRKNPGSVDYYLLSKYVDGSASEEEIALVEDLKSNNPDIAELLIPLDNTVTALSEDYKPLSRIRSPWAPMRFMKAACFCVAIVGVGVCLYYSFSCSEKMVFRGIQKSPSNTITNLLNKGTNQTEQIEYQLHD